ncbi:MAG: CDP-alcohol phosphatidyltransferase family protein [Acutalibacteraceae bacterium]
MEKLNIANAVTASRIIFAVLILFSDAFSMRFYFFYLFGALTDMIDGTIARKLNIKSSFGSLFDSIADCVFVLAVGMSILSDIYVPVWLWVWLAIIIIIKIINLLSSLLMFNRLVPMHTSMNKITGVLVFILPFILNKGPWRVSAAAIIVIGCIATFAAVQEGHYIRAGRNIE